MTQEEIIRASVAHNEKTGKLRVIAGSALLSEEEYIAFNKNPDFIAGAEWAYEHPKEGLVDINKVIEWLINHVNDYIVNDNLYSDNARDWLKVKSDCFDALRKAME